MDWNSCYGDIGKASSVPSLGCVAVLFTRVLNYAFIFAGTVAVIFIIWAGMKLVLSGGDPKQVGAARQIATYAIIGLIIILLSYAILNVIAFLTNVDCIKSFNFNSCNLPTGFTT